MSRSTISLRVGDSDPSDGPDAGVVAFDGDEPRKVDAHEPVAVLSGKGRLVKGVEGRTRFQLFEPSCTTWGVSAFQVQRRFSGPL